MSYSNACTVAAAVLDELVPSGRGVLFGIPGGAVSPIFDALLDRPGLRLVIAKHETQAAFMAMGYAHATAHPGIVLTTAGPGVTNVLTGLASASADGVPIIVVSGEVPMAAFGRGAVQEGSPCSIDVVSMARRVTKFASQVTLPSSATAIARRARSTALNGRRGPTFISLPLDVAIAKTYKTPIQGSVTSTFDVDIQACRQAVLLLQEARRPLMLVGSGARDGNGRAAVRAFAERLRLPVVATTKGKGVFPEDHPLYLGVIGLGGHDSVLTYLQEERADVLLVCGSSMNDASTNSWSPLLEPTHSQIQIDVDALQIGKNYRTDLGLLGPLDSVLSRMSELVEGESKRQNPAALVTAPIKINPGCNGRMSAQQMIATLSQACSPTTVYTCDFGEFLTPAVNFLRIREGGDFLLGGGFGSMGSSIGTAIGYKIGAPEKHVVTICGDGSFMMYGNDIATAVESGAAITFCVVNDGRLNMCHHGHLNVYGRTPNLVHDVLDIASAARALGADAEVALTTDELLNALSKPPTNGPRVIDARIDPSVVLAGSQRNAALRHFTSEPPKATSSQRPPPIGDELPSGAPAQSGIISLGDSDHRGMVKER